MSKHPFAINLLGHIETPVYVSMDVFSFVTTELCYGIFSLLDWRNLALTCKRMGFNRNSLLFKLGGFLKQANVVDSMDFNRRLSDLKRRLIAMYYYATQVDQRCLELPWFREIGLFDPSIFPGDPHPSQTVFHVIDIGASLGLQPPCELLRKLYSFCCTKIEEIHFARHGWLSKMRSLLKSKNEHVVHWIEIMLRFWFDRCSVQPMFDLMNDFYQIYPEVEQIAMESWKDLLTGDDRFCNMSNLSPEGQSFPEMLSDLFKESGSCKMEGLKKQIREHVLELSDYLDFDIEFMQSLIERKSKKRKQIQ